MSKIVWNDVLSVHIPEIDEQHKTLIEMINRLEDAVTDGGWSRKNIVMSDVLIEMINYLDYHFTTEENYMIDHHYPHFDTHRKQHKDFVNKVNTFADEYNNGTEALPENILAFLKEWLVDHVMGADCQFGTFVVEQAPSEL